MLTSHIRIKPNFKASTSALKWITFNGTCVKTINPRMSSILYKTPMPICIPCWSQAPSVLSFSLPEGGKLQRATAVCPMGLARSW
uniref:Uncharacterized protein n=1 Tax=Lotus japonicus TaxID=34305 RepID=I3S6G5_LOTJA|nr:unknown [Lotus japonicus]